MAEQPKQAFRDILKGFYAAMLVTRADDGRMHARPMWLAGTEDDGHLWFVTSMESAKVAEIARDPHVVATFQGNGRYLSLSGVAEVVRDRARIEALWSEEWRPWVPGGLDDPNLALLHVRGTEAEFWDQHGFEGLRYAFEAAKAVLTRGPAPPAGTERHGKVEL